MILALILLSWGSASVWLRTDLAPVYSLWPAEMGLRRSPAAMRLGHWPSAHIDWPYPYRPAPVALATVDRDRGTAPYRRHRWR